MAKPAVNRGDDGELFTQGPFVTLTKLSDTEHTIWLNEGRRVSMVVTIDELAAIRALIDADLGG